MPDPRCRAITDVLMRHGHYVDPEGPLADRDIIEWMIVDAERVLQGPFTYEGIDAALIDTGVHDPEECNDACVTDLLAVLGG